MTHCYVSLGWARYFGDLLAATIFGRYLREVVTFGSLQYSTGIPSEDRVTSRAGEDRGCFRANSYPVPSPVTRTMLKQSRSKL